MIITGSVVFRCFPTIREGWAAIQSAMRMYTAYFVAVGSSNK